MYKFLNKGLNKYNQQAYDMTMDMFDCLPLACLVNKKFLLVHGGISPDLKSVINQFIKLEDVKKIDRFREIPKSGLFCDLVWADPIDNKTGACDQIVKHNEVRGCSYFFGY